MKELCAFCTGAGKHLVRGYQESLEDLRPVKCKECRGTGERPKGTKAAEDIEYRKRYKAGLDRKIAELKKERENLG
jgi:hypothetical protein